MTRQNAIQTQQQAAGTSPLSKGGILQRQCESCGQHTIAGGECGDCGKKKIGLQRKLTIGASNDPLELEADRVADRVMSASPNSVVSSAPLSIQRFTGQTAGQAEMLAPASVESVLSSPGSPLEPGLQEDMSQRFGHDFSRVRVHTGDDAARSARDVNANAYTVGHNIVFGESQFVPNTTTGQRLVAHELTHVLQQSSVDGSFDKSSDERDPFFVSQQIKPNLQRQITQPTTSAPTFSINQETYLSLINQALGQMSGRLVGSETLATKVVPIIQAMLSRAIWKDAQGKSLGGGSIKYTFSRGIDLNLTLIFNDAVNSLIAGKFTEKGKNNGEIEIFVQRIASIDELSDVLYHETMHLLSSLINRPINALRERSSVVRGRGQAGAIGTLELKHQDRQVTSVHLWLDILAKSVNLKRAPGLQISKAALDNMAYWLIDEVNARIETQVFQTVKNTEQQIKLTTLPTIGTIPNLVVNGDMVNKYIFDLSNVFLPTDRASLNENDEKTLATLTKILEGIFQSRVLRRFNPSPYLIGRQVPRASFQLTPSPLTPPSFQPSPLPE